MTRTSPGGAPTSSPASAYAAVRLGGVTVNKWRRSEVPLILLALAFLVGRVASARPTPRSQHPHGPRRPLLDGVGSPCRGPGHPAHLTDNRRSTGWNQT